MRSPFTSRPSDANIVSSPHRLKRAKSVKDAFPPTLHRVLLSSLPCRSGSRRRFNRFPSPSSEAINDTPVTCLSDLEFNFSGSLDISDAESLPDLTDDASVAGSVYSAVTPTKNACLYFEVAPTDFCKKNLLAELTEHCVEGLQEDNDLDHVDNGIGPEVNEVNEVNEEETISIDVRSKLGRDSEIIGAENMHVGPVDEDIGLYEQSLFQSLVPLSIFQIPELVHKIIEYVDAQNTSVPREQTPLRRKPLSYKHALLIHGNEAAAMKAMQESQATHSQPSNPGTLHSCLLVNKLFHRITKEIMSSKVYFSNEKNFYQFVRNDNPEFFSSFRPTSLVLNKLFCAKQAAMDKITNAIDYSRLEWLEVNMCPKLLPSEKLLHSSLRTLIVTGSKILDDSLLVEVAKRCPNLQAIDLRACEGITDYGVYAIARSCTQITSINLGRKKRGHLITDHSVSTLVCNNKRLETVGLAGCYITDRTIWELAMNCGFSLERLSLNNCPYVTNQSLPVILQHNLLPNLSVLEIRFVVKITNFDPIVTFRRKQNSKGICMLIEMCEELLVRMRECEIRMDNYISESIFQDISDWANAKDEEDVSFQTLISARV